MARTTPHTIRQIVQLAAEDRAGEPSDRELLKQFATAHDADAFRVLVCRHGPMVLALCRALVKNDADAEDAFQATFLLLARKAASIRDTASLAAWLHGVAYRVAKKAQARFARRQKHEPLAARPEATPSDDASWREVQEVIHAELSALPDRYRVPLVLCYLRGFTQDEAAAQLKQAKNTLKARLERGRAILRARLVRRGLGPAALLATASWPGEASAVLRAELLESAVGIATGAPASAGVFALTQGVLSAMQLTKLKLAALAVLAVLAAFGLAMGGRENPAPAEPPSTANEEKQPTKPEVAPAPHAAVKGFDELTVSIRTSAFSVELPSTIKIEADGTCWYEVAGRPAVGNSPAWAPAKIKHKLPPERLRRLNELLKDTDWLGKPDPKKLQLHDSQYALALKRDGKTTTFSCMGEHEAYKALLTLLRDISAQEFLAYQLEWEPTTMTAARQRLDSYVRAELGERMGKSPNEIDPARYTSWATRLVRRPFDRPSDDVATAVRLVGLLKLESEREHLADLATDRDGYVREAVAQALGRLGGEKSVVVLRKMVRSTSDAPWELIKLGPIAVPAIAELIREGTDPDSVESERLVRAYIDHWSAVPKPIDAKVLDAVRAFIDAPKKKALRTEYHQQLLKLAEKDRKE